MEEQCTNDSIPLSWNCIWHFLLPQHGLVVIPLSCCHSIHNFVSFALPLVSIVLCKVCHHSLNCRFGISVPSTFFGAFFGFRKDVSLKRKFSSFTVYVLYSP